MAISSKTKIPVRTLLGLVVAATGLACGAAPARAVEYLVRPGDVLSLTFVGAPDMSYSIPVEIDGVAWFPIIGGVAVSGLSMAEVRSQMANAYSASSISFDTGGSAKLLSANQFMSASRSTVQSTSVARSASPWSSTTARASRSARR